MKRHLFLAVLIVISACKNAPQITKQEVQEPEKYAVVKHIALESLNKFSIKKMENWEEYKSVNEHLKKYTSISASEALNNALKLSDLVKQLKDSIRPTELITLSFRTRVNVLENEALRLKDMTYISAITAKEINAQVTKIRNAFSATNSKINAVYAQLEIEKRIENPIDKTDSIVKKKPVLKKSVQ